MMAMSTAEVTAKMDTEAAKDAANRLIKMIDNSAYRPPELVAVSLAEYAHVMNEIAVALCLVPPDAS